MFIQRSTQYLYFEGKAEDIRLCASLNVDRLHAPLVFLFFFFFDKGFIFGSKADMEELSAVGEQVFDAECILNKRLRKVRAENCWHF